MYADTQIAEFYAEYHQQVVRFLMSLVHHSETAEDLCQETFIKAIRAWDQRDPALDPRGWLFRIARNTAYDYFRQQRRTPVTALSEEAGPPIPSTETRLADTQAILAAMHQLEPHYRIPLMLYSYAGYPVRDIAQLLDVSDTAIKTRLHRARHQFRQHFNWQ
jgi:RNA polymerase sigma-70 factor, ECF subfamily